jgi:hypothetical protein
MVNTSPAATHGEELPTVPSIENWTAAEMLIFIQSRNILRDDKSRRRFEKAEIDGNSFLIEGDSALFWQHACKLQIAPSIRLSTLVKMIKRIGEEQPCGNTSFVS